MNKGTCFYRTLCFTLYLIRVVYISYTELAAGRSSEFVQTVHTDLHHTYTNITSDHNQPTAFGSQADIEVSG